MLVDTIVLVVTAVASVIAAVAALQARKHVETVHLLINSRMDQLLVASGKVANAAGRAEGIASMTDKEP